MSNRTSKVATFIAARIEELGAKQKCLAEAVGFSSPNVITMIKKGDTKLPLDKIGPMARALEVDPLVLLEMCFEEYLPGTWSSLREHVHAAVSDDEMLLIRHLRRAAGGPFIAALEPDAREHLDRLISSLQRKASEVH